MKILLIDNYDSFTYNLVHLLQELGLEADVFRNDRIELDAVEAYTHILLSPGPGLPANAGIMPEVIKCYGSSKSILGVCLGHQAIGEAYGAALYNLSEVKHGVTSHLTVTDRANGLFAGLPEKFRVTHYHSWAIHPHSVPDQLRITAIDSDGIIMSVSHRDYDVHGVQFHPESIMTEYGMELVKNWIEGKSIKRS
ncbi:MAG: aminodeoxychorismate/anthranilate synthase component II [Bacteroidetes bacterium]|nr:aminodeoxychorismate/anthranilate synthase component II [Bacteroidota bacterium]